MNNFKMPKMLSQIRYANEYGLPCVRSAAGKPPYGCGVGNVKERKFG